jgi:hypothetical protein
MAQLVGHDEDKAGQTVCDPYCGGGPMLLSAAKVDRNRELIGQDIDLRRVRGTRSCLVKAPDPRTSRPGVNTVPPGCVP